MRLLRWASWVTREDSCRIELTGVTGTPEKVRARLRLYEHVKRRGMIMLDGECWEWNHLEEYEGNQSQR